MGFHQFEPVGSKAPYWKELKSEIVNSYVEMPKITYTSVGFDTTDYPDCDGEKILDVSWSHLIWAAITVGKKEASELTKHGAYSRRERLMRLHMIKMNWKTSAKGEFQQTALYKTLDGSEKTAISYFTGLTIAKLLAGRCLQVPWLQHYDAHLRNIKSGVKGKRPDLIGVNQKLQWFALESKGRSAGLRAGVIEDALKQAEAVKPINGNKPLPIASVAHTKPATILYATWEDPPPEQPNESGYQINPLDFLHQYYQPIRLLISADSPGATIEIHGNREYTTRLFAELDIRVGLLNEPDSFFLTNSGWYENLTERLPRLRAIQQLISEGEPSSDIDDANTGLFIGRDGILVSLGPSWANENMILEPTERPIT